MTIAEFFNDSPWTAWFFATIYVIECIVIAILIIRLFKHQ